MTNKERIKWKKELDKLVDPNNGVLYLDSIYKLSDDADETLNVIEVAYSEGYNIKDNFDVFLESLPNEEKERAKKLFYLLGIFDINNNEYGTKFYDSIYDKSLAMEAEEYFKHLLLSVSEDLRNEVLEYKYMTMGNCVPGMDELSEEINNWKQSDNGQEFLLTYLYYQNKKNRKSPIYSCEEKRKMLYKHPASVRLLFSSFMMIRELLSLNYDINDINLFDSEFFHEEYRKKVYIPLVNKIKSVLNEEDFKIAEFIYGFLSSTGPTSIEEYCYMRNENLDDVENKMFVINKQLFIAINRLKNDIPAKINNLYIYV